MADFGSAKRLAGTGLLPPEHLTLTLALTLTPTLRLRLAGTGPTAYADTPCGSMGYAAPEQI